MIVEDSEPDALLVERQLKKAGYAVSALRVESAAAFTEALASGNWDVIIADYTVPGFGAVPALEHLKQSSLDIPFIIVSGAITDEIAVASMRAGAHDYVLKDNIARLVPAIEREIREAATRRQKREAEAAVRDLAAIVESSEDAILGKSSSGTITAWNKGAEQLYGYTAKEILGQPMSLLMPPDRPHEWADILQRVSAGESIRQYETRRRKKDGTLIDVAVTISPILGLAGKLIGLSSIARDISKRKRAEEALERSARHTQRVLDNLTAMVGVLSVDGTLLEANKVALDLAAVTSPEVIGKPFWETPWWSYDPGVQYQLRAAIKRAAKGETTRYDVAHATSGGKMMMVDFSLAPLRDHQGQITHLIASSIDITERKQAEQALRSSEEKLAAELLVAHHLQQVSTELIQTDNIEALYEQILDTAVAVLNADFASIQMFCAERGDGELRLLGYRGFTAEAARFLEWVRPDSHSTCGVALRTRQRVMVPDVQSYEFMAGSADLETYTIAGIRAVQTTPLFSRSGDLLGMISTHWREPHQSTASQLRALDVLARQAADLIDRKQAESALRKNKDRLRAVIDNLADGLIVLDPSGAAIDWNHAALQLHGYNERGDAPVLFSAAADRFDLYRVDGTPVPLEQWPLARLLRGEEICDYELAIRPKPEGQERIFSYGGTLVRDSDGQILVGLLTIRDITHWKKAQLALVRSEKLASVGRMAATIAHEINNPLAAAMNALYLVSIEPSLDVESRKHLELAETELERVAHLTKQTLGFYREAGTPTGLDVPEIIDGVLDIYRPKLTNKSIAIHRKFRCTARVLAIDGELRQIFSNLISNSIDAVDESGVLHLRTSGPHAGEAGNSMVRLTVGDSGVGISEKNAKRIFEPFFTTKDAVGTGLGLWVTSELVKKHGGRIRVRSKIGKGTVFSIWLPAERRQQERESRLGDEQ
jgi:PAS domain S-box-containing protein